MPEPPTVAERQRVERLIAAVMSGLDPRQAVASAVTDPLGIVTAVMLSEASEKVDYAEDGSLVGPDAPQSRRYMALAALFDVMSETARPNAPGS
ncbi:MAG: hypothetical protein ACXWNI_04145 [Candidatus Limnocylindrales bacterium]